MSYRREYRVPTHKLLAVAVSALENLGKRALAELFEDRVVVHMARRSVIIRFHSCDLRLNHAHAD